MTMNLQIVSISFIILIFSCIFYILRKGRISVKYSLVWLLSCFILFLFLMFPTLFNSITKVLGFNVGSNMIFAGLIAMLMFINLSLTIIISGQNDKIRLLIQEVSLIKGKIKWK